MKVEIIELDEQEQKEVKLFHVGLAFRGSPIYMESTGDVEKDKELRKKYQDSWLGTIGYTNNPWSIK